MILPLKCISTPSSPHYGQQPGLNPISSNRDNCGAHITGPHAHSLSPFSRAPHCSQKDWSVQNIMAGPCPMPSPPLIRTFPEPSTTLPDKDPNPYHACKALSRWSGLCHLSRHHLLPVCTFSNARWWCPLPRTAFASATLPVGRPPPHLQYPLIVLREAIPEPWPKSARLQNLHTLAQLGNSPVPSCESRDHLCSCWTPNPQYPVRDHLHKDFGLGPGTFWGPGPDLEWGLDSLCHYLPV